MIRSIHVGISGKLERWFLNDFKKALFQLHPIPTFLLDVENREPTLLRCVLYSTVLTSLNGQARLTLQVGLPGKRISRQNVLDAPAKGLVWPLYSAETYAEVSAFTL